MMQLWGAFACLFLVFCCNICNAELEDSEWIWIILVSLKVALASRRKCKFSQNFEGISMRAGAHIYIYIYILVYLGSRSFIMQVSLNFRWDVSLINFIVNRSNFLNKTFMSSDETRRMIKDSHFERKLYSVIL